MVKDSLYWAEVRQLDLVLTRTSGIGAKSSGLGVTGKTPSESVSLSSSLATFCDESIDHFLDGELPFSKVGSGTGLSCTDQINIGKPKTILSIDGPNIFIAAFMIRTIEKKIFNKF